MTVTKVQRDTIRNALVDFLDWHELYEQEGYGADADADRDYDRLTAAISDALEAAES